MATMQKRHFELIAKAFRATKPEIINVGSD